MDQNNLLAAFASASLKVNGLEYYYLKLRFTSVLIIFLITHFE